MRPRLVAQKAQVVGHDRRYFGGAKGRTLCLRAVDPVTAGLRGIGVAGVLNENDESVGV